MVKLRIASQYRAVSAPVPPKVLPLMAIPPSSVFFTRPLRYTAGSVLPKPELLRSFPVTV